MSRLTDNHRVLPPDERKIRVINRATVVDQQLIEATNWLTAARLDFRRQFLGYFWSNPPRWRILLRAALSSRRMVPTFASLGATRSGTTLLSDYIMQHPCVVLPLVKEIHSAYPSLRLINAQFPTLHEQQQVERRYGKAITGYCTPVMPSFLFPYAISAVAEKLKFIILLRNPVDRTFAHWRWQHLHTARFRHDPLWKNYPDFPEVVRVELDAIQSKATSGFHPLGCGGFIQHSIYLPFLKLLFRFYDKNDAVFIKSEEFFSAPSVVAKRVYQFLDLPDYDPVELPVRNAGPPGKMDPETRQLLADFFAPLNQELYDYIGQDFAWQ